MGRYRVVVEKTTGSKGNCRLNVEVHEVMDRSNDASYNAIVDTVIMKVAGTFQVQIAEKVKDQNISGKNMDDNAAHIVPGKDTEEAFSKNTTARIEVDSAGNILDPFPKSCKNEGDELVKAASSAEEDAFSDDNERPCSEDVCTDVGVLQFDLPVASVLKIQVNAMFRVLVHVEGSDSTTLPESDDQHNAFNMVTRSVCLNVMDMPQFERKCIIVDTENNTILETAQKDPGCHLRESSISDENKNTEKPASDAIQSANDMTTVEPEQHLNPEGYVMHLRVTNCITIDVQMAASTGQSEPRISIVDPIATTETSDSSKPKSEVEPTNLCKGVFSEASKGYQIFPFENLPSTSRNVLQARKELLEDTMIHRLEMLGMSKLEAEAVINRWSTRNIQHRPLSYRVPVANRCNSVIYRQILRLDDSDGSSPGNVLTTLTHHIRLLTETINSATVTLLELELFLMLPHFRTKAANDYSPNNRHGGVAPNFIQNWITVLRIAILQLRPSDESPSIHAMARKEIQAISKAVEKTKNNSKKLKFLIDEMEKKANHFRKVLFRKLNVTKEWAMQIEQKNEPNAYLGPLYRNITGVVEEEIFENHLYMQTGMYGLYMKRDLKEYWFPFSDLNFLERRVIFLGIADHMFSTFNAVQATVHHLHELFTPGYPMSFDRRVDELSKRISRDKKQFQLLSVKGKLDIYTATCCMQAAFTRMKYITKNLIKFSSDGSACLASTKFHVKQKEGGKILDDLKKIHTYRELNLVVPFSTLKVDGFSNLAQRGENPAIMILNSRNGNETNLYEDLCGATSTKPPK